MPAASDGGGLLEVPPALDVPHRAQWLTRAPSQDPEDVLYEEDIQRNMYSLKYWLRYLDAKRRSPAATRFVLFERALKAIPGSYKLWRSYLQERVAATKDRVPIDPVHQQTVNLYERSLNYMHKMPRIWMDYLAFLSRLPRPTFTRRAFDRALRSLPITQHDRIWSLYLRFVTQLGIPETAVRVYRRYLKVRARRRRRAGSRGNPLTLAPPWRARAV